MNPIAKPTGAQRPGLGHRSQSLDILRAVAIFMVMISHLHAYPGSNKAVRAVVTFLDRGGWVGVDLFFVLSGFLIAGLLFKEQSRHGAISFKSFFIRRGFKIYPAYYLMTAVTLPILAYHDQNTNVFKAAIPWLIYLQNYIYTPLGFIWGHTWSLAIEEQFYVLLPLVLIFLAKIKKSEENPFKSIPMIFFIVAGGCFVIRLVQAVNIPFKGMIHLAPFHVRMDSLFFGVFISYIHHYHPAVLRALAARARFVLLGAGAILLLPAFLFQLEERPFIYSIGFTSFYLGSGLILIAVLEDEPNNNFLAKTIAYIGARSYSIYLWHFPILWVAYEYLSKKWAPWFDWNWASGSYWVGATVFGVLISNAVERPFLKLRDRLCPSRSAYPNSGI